MKRLYAAIVIAASLMLLFPACEGKKTGARKEGALNVVATIFPPYDFARAIAGDKTDLVNLAMLLPPGAESHSFEPAPQDIITIQNSDMFIYVGGESDAWVERILESMDTSNLKIVRMIDAVDVVEEEIVEGMEDDGHEHEHEHEPLVVSKIEQRPLSDFAGSFKSVYPYLQEGAFNEMFAHFDEEDDTQTLEQVRNYWDTGLKSEYDKVAVSDSTVTFYTGNKSVEAKYEPRGFVVVAYNGEDDDYNKDVWYKYERVGEKKGAPKYIVFDDHNWKQGKAEHFHIYGSDESFEKLARDVVDRWPTYFDENLSDEETLHESFEHFGYSDGHEHEHEHEIDEHVWTSPLNAKLIVERISDAFCGTDPVNAVTYKKNADAYIAKLDALDREFQAVMDKAKRRTIVFGDRFPFRYFADRYGLSYFAAFPGCSTETEPSAATVAFLIEKIKAEKIPVVFHIELSNEKMADTIAEETGAKKLLFHAAHNISKRDFDNGVTFLDLQKANVPRLREALQ